MKPLLQETIILISIFTLFFLWEANRLEAWTIPFISILTAGYLIALHIPYSSPWTKERTAVFFITLTVLLIVSFTGGTDSLFFFLLFFLLFYMSFVFSPGLVFFFTFLTILMFFPKYGTNFESQMTLASLVFFSPLAYLFGKALQTKTSTKEQKLLRKESLKQIQTDAWEIKEAEQTTLRREDLSLLDDIIRKSRTLEHDE